jgi:hypothetical protein
VVEASRKRTPASRLIQGSDGFMVEEVTGIHMSDGRDSCENEEA